MLAVFFWGFFVFSSKFISSPETLNGESFGLSVSSPLPTLPHLSALHPSLSTQQLFLSPLLIPCLPLVLISLFRKLCMVFSNHSPSIYCLLYSLSSTLTHFNNLFSSPPHPPTLNHSLPPSLPISLQLWVYSFSTSFCVPGRLTEREIG